MKLQYGVVWIKKKQKSYQKIILKDIIESIIIFYDFEGILINSL